MMELGLGDAADLYHAWAAQVKRDGGVVVTLPGTTTPAGRFPYTVWGPKVNARVWPLPTTYDKAGKGHGYYVASSAVEQSARALKNAKPSEVPRRNPLDVLGEIAGDLKKTAVWGVGIYVAIKLISAMRKS